PILYRMQDKHRFMVRALTHRYRRDRADGFIEEMRARIDRLRTTLADGQALAAVLVVRAEAMVEAESRRYLESLRTLRMTVAAVVVNAVPSDVTAPVIDETIPHYTIPAWTGTSSDEAGSGAVAMPSTRMLTIV